MLPGTPYNGISFKQYHGYEPDQKRFQNLRSASRSLPAVDFAILGHINVLNKRGLSKKRSLLAYLYFEKDRNTDAIIFMGLDAVLKWLLNSKKGRFMPDVALIQCCHMRLM
ncbi:MAG: hypothetical protein R2861_00800 [Desulfobacterales bacterium]